MQKEDKECKCNCATQSEQAIEMQNKSLEMQSHILALVMEIKNKLQSDEDDDNEDDGSDDDDDTGSIKQKIKKEVREFMLSNCNITAIDDKTEGEMYDFAVEAIWDIVSKFVPFL